MEYDVVVWLDDLSDGSKSYAAVCPAISHAHGQGDTEAEVLIDVADTMALYLEKMPGRVKTGQAAEDELAELVSELTAWDSNKITEIASISTTIDWDCG